MTVINQDRLYDFVKAHSDARKALTAWLAITAEASWRSIVDVRQVFPSADGVEVRKDVVVTVFNIRGNLYRLITIVVYAAQTVDLAQVPTHAEYNKNMWKNRI